MNYCFLKKKNIQTFLIKSTSSCLINLTAKLRTATSRGFSGIAGASKLRKMPWRVLRFLSRPITLAFDVGTVFGPLRK